MTNHGARKGSDSEGTDQERVTGQTSEAEAEVHCADMQWAEKPKYLEVLPDEQGTGISFAAL